MIDTTEYVAAVEERQHLEKLLEAGRKEFSGYGLELFQRGVRAKIAKLTNVIENCEALARSANPISFINNCEGLTGYWNPTSSVYAWQCKISDRSLVNPPSIAVLSDCATINTNVQVLQGRILDLPVLSVTQARVVPQASWPDRSVLATYQVPSSCPLEGAVPHFLPA